MRSKKEIEAKLKELTTCAHTLCSIAETYEEERMANLLKWVLNEKNKQTQAKKILEGVQFDLLDVKRAVKKYYKG